MGGYERRLSLGLQFEHEMLGKINKYAYERAYAIMKKAADKVVEAFKKNREFYNVTGNTFTSFYASVYYRGKLMYVSRSADGEAPPTRPTLRKVEIYDKPSYYEGDEADPPFRGKTGKGGQWGPNLIYGRIGKFKPGGEWALMCVCPVEYAKFNEKIVETVYSTYEDVPFLLQIGIAETNGTINFDI